MDEFEDPDSEKEIQRILCLCFWVGLGALFLIVILVRYLRSLTEEF